MKAYDHLKINQLLKGGVYQRFTQFLKGHSKAISKAEFDQFEAEYKRQHSNMTAWLKEAKKSDFK